MFARVSLFSVAQTGRASCLSTGAGGFRGRFAITQFTNEQS
jgi:phage protein U